jgi:hypothetical protein
MTSRWPTELGEDGTAPSSVMVVTSGDAHLMRQALYQLQAARQLQDRGYEPTAFQVPLVGRIVRITIPVAVKTPSGDPAVVYTESEEWTRERLSELHTWIANLREESAAPVIVASRVAPPDAAAMSGVAELLHLPYDTLNTVAAGATDEAAPLLPCLKERRWIGRERTVCRALWENEASAYMPWLAIGYDHPHTFQFIDTAQLAAMNATERDLEAQAFANLARRPATWQPLDVDMKGGKRLHMLLCRDDFFAAERIADAGFMRKAQQLLKARGLLVGIPRRGLLMAIDGESDRQTASAFGVAVAAQFSDGESALISPMLFGVKDGAIVGIVESCADAVVAEGGAETPDDAPEEDPGAPHISAIVSRNDRGTEDVHLLAGGEDGLRLAKGIESGFMHLMKEHAARKEFSGHFQIVVLGMTPPAAREHIPSVLAHLHGICSEVSTAETRYRVTLTYQQAEPGARAAEDPAPSSSPATASPMTVAPAPAGTGSGRSSRMMVRVVLGILLALIALSKLLASR